jgi:hypothetical protein
MLLYFYTDFLLFKLSVIINLMKKEKIKWGLYLPKEIYAELYRRQLPEHFSFLVACLLEEFFKRTDISISREEMLTKAEQREYLKRKLQEFFSGTIKGGPERVSKKTEEDSWKEPTSSSPEVKKEEKKEEVRAEDREEMEDEELRRKEEFLKRYEQFW